MTRPLHQQGASAPDAAAEDGRSLRRDARENRMRILAAAETVLAEQGADAPIDAVAERAGVGVGTLYRHFASKEALYAAVCESRVHEIVDEAIASRDAEDPGAALFALLAHFGELAQHKKDFIDALRAAGVDVEERMHRAGEEILACITPLVERAQAADQVRRDIGAKELCSLVAGACLAAEHAGEGSRERMLGVVFAGLRPPV